MSRTYQFSKVYTVIIILYLILPILFIIPLSFNKMPYFTYTIGMLHLHKDAFSLRWYQTVLHSADWHLAFMNSFLIALPAALFATILGTLASISLANPLMPFKRFFLKLFLAPLVVPIILISVGMFFMFTQLRSSWIAQLIIHLTGRYELITIILAHIALATPFVVVLVSTSLKRFNPNLMLAAYSLGANKWQATRKILLRNIIPGVASGALLAFITSLDELVIVLMLSGPHDKTISYQMFSGLREQLDPSILAVATILISFSTLLLLIMMYYQARQRR